ncbi:MAG: DoxX family protein [Actinomycetota bacterium]|nr:DoxX family protein [Actinomycetota bacterium]
MSMTETTRLTSTLAGDASKTLQDAALLVLRCAAAAVFIAHGAADIFDAGISTNVDNYTGAGIPLPALSAPFAAIVQFFGGFALLLGLVTRPVAAGLVVVMGGALIWVHRGESLVMGQDGSGSGYALAMGVIALAVLILGPGRLSADRFLAGWLSQRDGAASRRDTTVRRDGSARA